MGCVMGTICAPSYANIFMASFEAKHIYPYIKEMSLLYLRCIDVLFIIWKDAKAEIMTFIKELNTRNKTIKFDFQISSRKIPIFDLMLYKDEISTSKQLYIINLQINKHSCTLNQNTQDL